MVTFAILLEWSITLSRKDRRKILEKIVLRIRTIKDTEFSLKCSLFNKPSYFFPYKSNINRIFKIKKENIKVFYYFS